MTKPHLHRVAAPLAITFAAVAVGIAGVAAWLPADVPPAKALCCLAGKYRGSHAPNPLPNCPLPKSEPFTMAISQAAGCGADVWGTITDASGHVNRFRGTIRGGATGCCLIEASFADPARPGRVVSFRGAFCRGVSDKWSANGTFTETGGGDPCKKDGVWKAVQM